MATKKMQANPVEPAQQTAEGASFPYPVEPPFRAGWEHAVTKKYGTRGKAWTSTKSEPQWTVRFRDSEAAAWFKSTWAAGARQPAA
jgi:hypothetical protein